ncbi:chromate transporter [Treponema pectinovorum]|uniref:chromate transporter n=1 Tax=Treponema pectinovorum TaxID=164 RepID=UPI0011CA0CA5|nr:chromate transporter [Treponema pectinovorum]
MSEFLMNEIQSQTIPGLFCLAGLFFYIGLITIGGGQVGITIMQQMLVDNFPLLSEEKFFNMVAISESTPGPIGINMATYVGTELYGVFGGVITTFGQVLPSLITIILIVRFFGKFSEKKGVQAAFSTLRPAVSGVIAVAAVRIFILALVTILPSFNAFMISTWQGGITLSAVNVVFYLLCLVLLFKTEVHPVFIVLAGAIYGVFFC